MPTTLLQVLILSRKLEEGNEVIDAVKAQLVDYRHMVSQVRDDAPHILLESGVWSWGV